MEEKEYVIEIELTHGAKIVSGGWKMSNLEEFKKESERLLVNGGIIEIGEDDKFVLIKAENVTVILAMETNEYEKNNIEKTKQQIRNYKKEQELYSQATIN